MFTTGSKFLFGAAVAAALGAVLYGVIEGGALGTVGLTFAAAALAALGGVVLWARDSDVSSMDVDALHLTAAAARPPSSSLWPVIAAVGLGLLVLGLVTDQSVFLLGLLVVLAATLEWAVHAWSDRATADAGYNREVRTRLAHPLELPVLAAAGVAVIVFSFSRIMLFLSKTGGPVAFSVIAALVLLIGFVIAARPSLKGGAIGAVIAIGVAGLVAGGIASALGGEREMEIHETAAALGDHGECATPEETHADDNASQTVAATANVMGVITLHDDDTLTATGQDLPESDTITIMRNNPTNVVFHNNSPHERRLVLDAGQRFATPGDASSELVPAQFCTALVEEGGTQMLTFTIATPSAAAEQPMTFTVPGVDGASVEVVVP